ncbi:isoprenylcysteine carboxylmethyltransferase family protein [Agromyces endophyticus]|uniref:methyltransferase family protein n=1 Tax=Agromyces sp. H17E-10 TaxID=2932244 RepID=UPI001FCF9525|nr:isoprenylcysteine carboxylmethyltransferase family protein [Agromyces sp. H17E-10]UOQ91019.1 isoprenylcysteine carboxylmethyltransferase family protein [Agromyces sp. H17E-10]
MRWGRCYFAAQAIAGALWWIGVAVSPELRFATLGSLDVPLMALLDLPLFVGASAVAAFGSRIAAVIATGWTLIVTLGLSVFATMTTEAGWGVLAMIAASTGSLIALCLVVFGRVPTEWALVGPLGFRAADATRSTRAHVVATFVQLTVFWGLFLVVIPVVIAFFERRWALGLALTPAEAAAATAIGVVVLAVASALGIWSAVAMSTKGEGTPLPSAMANRLVIAGPYRYVRNPMALSGVLQAASVGLLLSSWLVVAYAIVGAFYWNLAVRPLEEGDLEARFGDEFAGYRRAVRCWWPRMRPFVGEQPTAEIRS